MIHKEEPPSTETVKERPVSCKASTRLPARRISVAAAEAANRRDTNLRGVSIVQCHTIGLLKVAK